jgi:probable DNA metabolism protein
MRPVLVYDGSWPGWLCAVAEALNAAAAGLPPPAVRRSDAPGDLFAETMAVPTDQDRARSVWERLGSKRGAEAARRLLEAWCSDLDGADAAAAALAVRLWREGAAVLDDLADPDAALVEKAGVRTTREAHHWVGFLRFAESAEGWWYAPLASACDVLFLIADHFAARFPTLRWIIHDGARGTAAIHEPGGPWRAVWGFSVDAAALSYSERELGLQAAWAGYFKAVAIAPRKNPRLQATLLPKRYRVAMPEFAAGRGATEEPRSGL